MMERTTYTPSQIRQLAEGIEVGGQRSGEVCPQCNGGLHKETSLSINRSPQGLSYKCHRAKCGLSGFIPMAGVAVQSTNVKVPDQVRKFYSELVKVPDEIAALLLSKYGLQRDDLERGGFLWAPTMDKGRVAMPIKTRWMTEIGHSFRSLNKKVKPKNRILLHETGKPGLAYFLSQEESAASFHKPNLPIVLVEDQISALRVSKFCNAIALLGTNLSADKVVDIVKCLPKKVVLALDEDATKLAAEYVCRYQGFLPQLSMVQLKWDLKDLDDDAIKQELKL